jgi:hypothetical protein
MIDVLKITERCVDFFKRPRESHLLDCHLIFAEILGNQ